MHRLILFCQLLVVAGASAQTPRVIANVVPLQDRAATWSAGPVAPRTLAARPSVEFPVGFGITTQLLLARAGDGTAVFTHPRRLPEEETQITIARLNLVSDSPPGALLQVPASPEWRIRAIDPEGKRIAVLVGETQVDVLDLATQKPLTSIKIEDKTSFSYVYAMEFIDAHRLIAMRDRELVCWDIEKGTMLWRRTGAFSKIMALTGDGKYLVTPIGTGMQFVDPATGRDLGVLRGDPVAGVPWAIHPDGTALAAMGTNAILIWDLKTGQRAHTLYTQRGVGMAPLQWVNDDLILAGKYVYSIKAQCAVWQLSIGAGVKIHHQPANDKLWYTVGSGFRDKKDKATFRALPLPVDKITRAAETVKAPAPVIGAGTRVSLAGTTLDEAEKQLFLTRLAKENVEVADDAPIRLVTSITTKSLGSTEFQDRRGGDRQMVERFSTTRRIAWERTNGEVLWENSTVVETPDKMSITVRAGQSAQEVVGKEEREARTRPLRTASVPVPLLGEADATSKGETRVD